ncbi:unnamed protein product [Cochlearia groenlandica]
MSSSSSIKRPTPPSKSSEIDSSSSSSSNSARRSSIPRRYRSLSRFSHRMPDLDSEATPMRKGKFVNTVRGSNFAEISLDDLAVEFFESFSSESGLSSGERGRRSGQGEEDTRSQRRGRSVSRVGGNGGGLRSSGENCGDAIRGRAIEADREKPNSRRRRSLSVVRRRIDNSESDVDQVLSSSKSRDAKSFIGGKSQNSGTRKSGAGERLGRSCSQNPIKYHHDGYSSQSSAVTDDEGKESSSNKHGTERIIRTVFAQNKATPKKRESLGNSDNGAQRKSNDAHRTISTFTKGYATKLQESEERKRDLLAEIMLEEERSKELSMNLKELLIEDSSESNEKPSRMRKRSKDRSSSRRMSMCLTDEAEQFIDEFISNIEDTDFSSFEDERSESGSSFGLTKTQSSQSATFQKSVPVSVETDGIMLPWLQWETPDDTCVALECLNKTPNTKLIILEPDQTQDSSSGQGTRSVGTISSRGSWSPYESDAKHVDPIRRLKIDVSEYLKRPNSAEDILCETWKLRHRINSGSLVISNRLLI